MPRRRATNQVGDLFEKQIRDYFRTEIAADRFWVKSSNCKVFWRKGYHSKDRNTEIVFDVSIELYLPGAKEYSALILIECKNYKHSVQVNDIEEFFAKVQQVAAANAKAVVASTAAFQTGTREFARSKGIGLLRYFDPSDFKWELMRSPSASAGSTSAQDTYLVQRGLSQPEFRSYLFDLYFQSPIRETNSLWDFFDDLVRDSGLQPEQIRSIANLRNRVTNRVPFLEKDEIEGRSAEILADIGYSGAEVDLSVICDREKRGGRLVVKTGLKSVLTHGSSMPLGRITFTPPLIEIFLPEQPHPARERFTLAHELAHHFLNHGRFMMREYCEEADFVLHRRSAISGSDVARLEFQANYFASSLLMPRAHFLADFQELARSLNISDHGFGALYLDDQPCNLLTFRQVTDHFMLQYGISRTSAKIRLESLGLLSDARRLTNAREELRFFSLD